LAGAVEVLVVTDRVSDVVSVGGEGQLFGVGDLRDGLPAGLEHLGAGRAVPAGWTAIPAFSASTGRALGAPAWKGRRRIHSFLSYSGRRRLGRLVVRRRLGGLGRGGFQPDPGGSIKSLYRVMSKYVIPTWVVVNELVCDVFARDK